MIVNITQGKSTHSPHSCTAFPRTPEHLVGWTMSFIILKFWIFFLKGEKSMCTSPSPTVTKVVGLHVERGYSLLSTFHTKWIAFHLVHTTILWDVKDKWFISPFSPQPVCLETGQPLWEEQETGDRLHCEARESRRSPVHLPASPLPPHMDDWPQLQASHNRYDHRPHHCRSWGDRL